MFELIMQNNHWVITNSTIKINQTCDFLGSAIGTTSLLSDTSYGPSLFALNVGIYFRNWQFLICSKLWVKNML